MRHGSLQFEEKKVQTDMFMLLESSQTFETFGKDLYSSLCQKNNNANEIEQFIFPESIQNNRDYHKFDQKGIRKIKTLGLQCLKKMNMKHLYKYWAKKKRSEGERNKRYLILLFIFIIAHEGKNLVQVFMQKYKDLCSEIINEKSQKFKSQVSSTYHQSVKYHLKLSISAGEAFINSNFNIDAGLKIMQNCSQGEYYEHSKNNLKNYMNLIRKNQHKRFKIIEQETNLLNIS